MSSSIISKGFLIAALSAMIASAAALNMTSLIERAGDQDLVAGWARGSYSVADLKGGGSSGYNAGFQLLTQDGEAVYDEAYPGGGTVCGGNAGPVKFRISGTGSCSGGCGFDFICGGDILGNPEECSIQDYSGNVVGSGTGDSDTNFYGIFITVDGLCRAQFHVPEGDECAANADLNTEHMGFA